MARRKKLIKRVELPAVKDSVTGIITWAIVDFFEGENNKEISKKCKYIESYLSNFYNLKK